MRSMGIKILFMILGAIAILFLNYSFIEQILIPDPCYYHSRETSFLFRLFYDTPAFNGGHPFPSLVNIIFTIAIGLLIGWGAYRFFLGNSKGA